MHPLQRPDGLHESIGFVSGFFEVDYSAMNSKRPGETTWGANPNPGYRVLATPAENRHGVSVVVLNDSGYLGIVTPSGKYDSPGAERFRSAMQLDDFSRVIEPTAQAFMSAATWNYDARETSRLLFSCGKSLYGLSVDARLSPVAIDWLHCENDVKERELIRTVVGALLDPKRVSLPPLELLARSA